MQMIYFISYSCHRKLYQPLQYYHILFTTVWHVILTHTFFSTPSLYTCRTFHKDHMSVEEVAKSLADTIPGIQFDKAHDLSMFAKYQGFSVLGSSTREECLSLGEKLLASKLDCRIIPYNRGSVVPESFPEETVVAVAETVAPQEAIVDDTYLLSYN